MVDIARLGIGVDTTDLKRGEAELRKFAKTGDLVDDQIDEITRSSRQAGAAVAGMGKSASTAGRSMGSLGLRNVGLQLNQVAQQGAITGNYIQALAFQMPDLLLGFGSLGIAAGIAAGALTPLITGLFDTTSATETLEKELEALEGAIASVREPMRVLEQSADQLAEKYGAAATQVRMFAEEQTRLRIAQATSRLRDQVLVLRDLSKEYSAVGDEAITFTAIDASALDRTAAAVERIQKDFGLTKQAAAGFAEQLRVLSEQKTLEGQRTALEGILSTLRLAGVEAEAIPEDFRIALDEMISLNQATAELEGLLGRAEVKASGLAGSMSQAAIAARDFQIQQFYTRQRFADEDLLMSMSLEPSKAAAASVKRLTTQTKKLGAASKAAEKPAKTLADTLKGHLKNSVNGIAGAFEKFISGGLTDFRSFAKSILQEFTSLIGKMVAMAARHKLGLAFGIKQPAGQAGSFGQIGGALSKLGGGKGFMGGLGNAVSGGLGGLFKVGGNAAAAGGGLGASLGAALPLLGVGLALFSLFKKKPVITKKDFAAIQSGLQLTGMELLSTGMAGKKAARDLKKMSGGVENFQNRAAAYFDLFFTQEEKRAKTQSAVDAAFGRLNLSVPATKKEFRSLVEGLDLTTKGGRRTYSELLKIAPAFAAISSEAQSLDDALSRLTGSQGVFQTLQDKVFVGSQLSQGVQTADDGVRLLLNRVIETVRAGNITLARNTKDTADSLLRTELSAV